MKAKLVIMLCIVSYLVSGQCINPTLICPTCNCMTLYDPVLGCDGKIYSNSCVAQRNGVTSWTPYYLTDIDNPQINENKDIKISINSADNTLVLESQQVDIEKYSLYNVSGILVSQGEINQKTYIINVKNLSKGVYIIVVKVKDLEETAKKIIIQ